ncbi:hypothetical protein [Aliarcobacter lanthieri]|uniref:hypothetical protein n=1 Tax=Aliarcobacter lanthieri TaxID=1355374 RepID=UPI00352FFCA3
MKEYFSAWEDAIAKILENKYGKFESKNIAMEYVSLTQGAIMMMNLYENTKNYLKVGEKLVRLL